MGNDTKPKGWFSKKHPTDAAHNEARLKYQIDHPRINTEPHRLSVSDMTEPQVRSRWLALDTRLGANKGATKERARLAHRLKELVL